VLIIIGLVAGGSVTALLLSKQDTASESSLNTRAARVERVEGDVGVAHAFDAGEQDWAEATINTPLTAGDRIEASDNSRATVAFTGRRHARLDPGATLDVLSLADQRTQLALRDGSALFDLSDLGEGEMFEIATPNGAVDFIEPGLYQVGYGDDGNTWISVLSGLAQVVGLAGSGEIGTGEILTLAAQVAAPVLLSKIAPELAGGIVDDYYGNRYPDAYDGRYRDYDRYLDDPFYYDPYRRSTGYRYVNDDIPGVYDLDRYGDWVEVGDYGRCWTPRVETGWSPYRDGYWHNDNLYGPTWVSQEPWGWAPYHYGRWANTSGRWVWVPDSVSVQPRYAPALVAFVPIRESNQVGWVPLAPGERYVPRYYDDGYNPHYLGSPDVVRQVVNVRQHYVNLAIPEAVTVVPIDRFTGRIRPDSVGRLNPKWLAHSQPVLDPFAVSELRQLAQSRKEWKRHLKHERRLARQRELAPVVASVAPTLSPFERRSAERIQVTTVPDRERKRQLKIERRAQKAALEQYRGPRPPVPNSKASPVAQERGQLTAAQAIERARERQALSQVEREQRKQGKRIRKEQKRVQQAAAQPVRTVVNPQPGVDLERQQRKAQKQAARQQRQAIQQRPQVVAPQAAPVINPRKAERQAARQQRKQAMQVRAVQKQQQPAAPVVKPQATVNIERQQRKAQKQAARQQRQVVQQRPQVVQQTAPVINPRKAERQAARQQRKQQANPQPAQRVELKGPPASGAAQDRAQRKAEKAQRKAARGKN
jgi:hypothetical protein